MQNKLDRDNAIKLIRFYKREIDRSYNKCALKQDRYYKYAVRWATNDLLEYVLSHPDTSIILTIEEYIRKMAKYSCKKGSYSYIFSIASDVACYILDMLYSRLYQGTL